MADTKKKETKPKPKNTVGTSLKNALMLMRGDMKGKKSY